MSNIPLSEDETWSKIEAKIDKTETCWLWRGYVDRKGYGSLAWFRKNHRAHRFIYERLVGPIPRGLVIDHLCRVRHCVNPDHMEPVTNKVNLLRGEGFPAQNLTKTHCPSGHEYAPENTYYAPSQSDERACRACHRERERARRVICAVCEREMRASSLKLHTRRNHEDV